MSDAYSWDTEGFRYPDLPDLDVPLQTYEARVKDALRATARRHAEQRPTVSLTLSCYDLADILTALALSVPETRVQRLLTAAETRPLTDEERQFLMTYAKDRTVPADLYMRIKRTMDQQYARINPHLS